MKRNFKYISVFFVLLMFVACAGTAIQNRLMTADTFNSIYKQYLDAYDRQPVTIQQEWKVKVDPLFAEASLAMGAYLAITDPSSSEATKKLEMYKAAKDQAVRLLFTYGITIKEE